MIKTGYGLIAILIKPTALDACTLNGTSFDWRKFRNAIKSGMAAGSKRTLLPLWKKVIRIIAEEN